MTIKKWTSHFMLTLVIFMSTINPSLAQKLDGLVKQIDSLNVLINSPKSHDTTVAIALLYMANLYVNSNPDTAFVFCEKSKLLSEKNNFDRGLSKSYGWLGYLHSSIGNESKAEDYILKSISVRQRMGDKKGASSALINLGSIKKDQGKIKEALDCYFKSLDLSIESNHLLNQGICNLNIGTLFDDIGEEEEAMKHYRKSLTIADDSKDNRLLSNAYSNIGHMHHSWGASDSALFYWEKSLKIAEENNFKNSIGQALHHIGDVLIERGDFDQGLSHLKRALQIFQETSYKSWIGLTHHKLGLQLFNANKTAEALSHANEALKIGEELGHVKTIERATRLLTKIYQSQGNWKLAHINYRTYIEMRDSLKNLDNKKTIIRQQMQYEYDKKVHADSLKNANEREVSEAKLAAADAENRRQKIEAKQQRQQNYFLYGGLAIAILFALFIFNRFRVARKQRDIINTQKIKVDNAYLELEEKNTEILDSITYAKRIQSAILPPQKLVKSYLENSFILYKPKDIVAGDFYWMEPFVSAAGAEGKIDGVLFAAADCTGHGVPGAMVSVICNNGLNRAVREYGIIDPGRVLDKAREIVISEFEKSEEDVKDGMDIALCSLTKNKKGESELKYAGANNPLWILRDNKSNYADINPGLSTNSKVEVIGDYLFIEVKSDKQPIGKYANMVNFKTHSITLYPGDCFYIFSDGFSDQFGGAKGKKYKATNFKKLLASIAHESMDRQKELIENSFENWMGQLEQLDDVCVIGVQV